MRRTSALLALLGLLVAAASAPAQLPKLKDTPLPVEAERAFPELRFVLPILLTHAGDGSNRVFVVEQQGRVHVFANRQDIEETEIFLDISDRVVYKDNENEEGLLGMAFHPKYKQNGEFFVFYTTTKAPHTSVISRLKVSKDNPNRADPASEEELLRVPQPFWNHNGGTVVFGPDGYLYVGLGDGGSRDDPRGNGQNLGTLNGSILRIDVDGRSPGRNYAIPADNPFVGNPQAQPEIWAYGLRNVWRMAFDSKTGVLWAADVGQDIWEEINLIVRGGNYGWNLREAAHKFGPKGSDPRPDLIDPIWEYHHDIGKSITGGHVYRGKRVPQLEGLYLYADYVGGQLWGLKYDPDKKQVVANYSIEGPKLPVMSYGEDEQLDAYFMIRTGDIYRFRAKE
jgi:glucose/arabinose dehydrogenase